MLEAIREHAQGWIAKIILGFIALTFAVWGIDWYFQGDGKEKPAAQVNKMEIGQKEFLDQLQKQQEAMGLAGRPEADTREIRAQVLDQLVNSRLLAEAAQGQGLVVTELQVGRFIEALEPFHENGKFSEARLDAWLKNRGMVRAQFLQMVRQDLLLRQLQVAYAEGAVVSLDAARRLSGILAQQREVQEAVFDIRAHINAVRIDAAAVEAEYKAHPADYRTPAQLRIEYVVLSPEVLSGGIAVDEAAARQYYDANASRFAEPEQRRASHILVKVEAGMDAKARQAARAKAEQLLREVQATPARFAELARKHSDDPGSGAQGGDLGPFTRDRMVKPFADAAFAMKPGEVKGPVETQFGYHIIRLDGVTPARRQPFDAVKPAILQALQQQEAQRRFAEAADRFSNLAYEQPDSLAPAAKAFGLTIQQSGWIGRAAAQPVFLGNRQLMDALFAPEALEKKQNTEAIEVAPNTLVAARVLEHRPEGQRPLAEVAGEIRLKLAAEVARKQAVEAGRQALQSARAGQAPMGMSAPMLLSRMQPLGVPVEGVRAVFAADAKKLPAYVGVETRDGYRLYRINRLQDSPVSDEQVRLAARDMQRLAAQEELRVYLDYLRGQAKIVLNQEILEKKTE